MGKQFANKTSFLLLRLNTGKLYFREAMVSLLPFYFFNFFRGETLITVYRCMTFCGIIEL